MRVRRSAMGSVMLMRRTSPARLRQTGDLAAARDFADLHARQPELAVHPARAAGHAAALALADRARIARQSLQLRLCGRPLLGRSLGAADQLLELRTLRGVLLRNLGATLLALDHVRLGHSGLLFLYFRNGKLNASSSARPCLSSAAVVVIVMSMPRTWST